KLKPLRKEKKWSQEIVAEHLGISQSTYARIEKGICNSWLLHLKDICTLYKIDLNDFLKINSQENSLQTAQTRTLVLEKLIEQYELRLQEKEVYIASLEQKVVN
ncbi:MAG: helix-turn-helix domain-containing protein, partial [Polaribacter sp.]